MTTLFLRIEEAAASVNAYAHEHRMEGNPDIKKILLVLSLLRNEAKGQLSTSVRVLRAFKDVSTLVATQYEHTPFFDKVFAVYDLLEAQVPSFKGLELLRADFGKGVPI